jgi:predicted transcriptional regulator
MPSNPYSDLSRRERQIMDVLYRLGSATAREVISELQDERHSSTVRTQLRLLEEKGHIRREPDGNRFIYRPVVSRAAVRKSAIRHLVDTFFEGSTEKAMSTLLATSENELSKAELERLSALIDEAAKEGGS